MSSPPSADARTTVAAAGFGIALLSIAWGLLHVGFYADGQISDTPVYQRYGDPITDGAIPYRDFEVEYPPGALPAFILRSLAAEADYRTVFEWLMLACAVGSIAAMAAALVSVRAPPARLYAATAFAGMAPLLLGSVVLTRYDLWPAALATGALAAILAGRRRLGPGILALATAAKLWPLVLLPLMLLYTSRRWGDRAAGAGFGVFAGVLALIVVPLAASSPAGLWRSLEVQLGRPLQIESLGSSMLLVLDRLGAYKANVGYDVGSHYLEGSLPGTLASIQTVLQLVALIGVWGVYAVSPRTGESLLAASAAAVASFVAFGKVVSPQFLLWLVPLVPLVGGRLGLDATATLLAALVLTQTWFPSRYWDVVAQGPEAWLVVARNILLVAIALTCALAIRGRSERRSANPWTSTS